MKKNIRFQFQKKGQVSSISQIHPVIIGRLGPPILACIRSWGRQGYPVGFICVVSGNSGKPVSKYLTDSIFLEQQNLFTNKGTQTIVSFLKKNQATDIIAIDERISIWLNDIAGELPDNVRVCSSSNETMKNVLSKQKQIEIAKKAGFQILPTYFIDKDFKDGKEFQSIEFPLCLRPSRPGSIYPPFKVKIAESPKQLRKILNTLETINEPIICQPFKNFPNLVIHGVRTLEGKTERVEAFIVERKFEGVTLILKPITIDSKLFKKCQLFTEIFKIIGNYHFEFLYEPKTKQAFFLEMNLRLGGTTAKVFSCGYDEPMLALTAFNHLIPINKYTIQNCEVSSRQALLKYLFYSFSGKLTSLDYPSNEPQYLRMKKIFQTLFFCKDEVLNFDDIKGSLSLYFQNLRTAIL